MTKVRLINSKRTVGEFTKEAFNEEEIDLLEYTDQFGQQSLYIFADKTEDGVIVFKAISRVAIVIDNRYKPKFSNYR